MLRPASGFRIAGRRRHRTNSEISPSGMLTKKIQCQPHVSVMKPGFITDTWGWHWIFFVNIPLGLISLFVLWRLLPAIRKPEAGRNIDYLGAAVFTGAVAPFLIGLSNKQSGDWS